jgi:hypothetical protein
VLYCPFRLLGYQLRTTLNIDDDLLREAQRITGIRSGDTQLVGLLEQGQVLMHTYVLGEMACGNLHQRSEVLGLLRDLPASGVATDDEVFFLLIAIS